MIDVRQSRAACAACVLASLLVLGAATLASAHTQVTSSSPASGTTAKRTISRVTVTFSGQLRSGTLRVVGPGGKVASKSSGGRDPRNPSRLLVGLKGSLAAGGYKASWTIVAADGHRLKGSFRFRVA
jgi:methionine-rich copper-binding protein CopC